MISTCSHLNLQLAGGAESLEGALSRRCGFTKLLSRFDTRSGVTGTPSFPPDLRCRECEHNWPRPGPPALLEMFIWARGEAALGQSQASDDHNEGGKGDLSFTVYI